MAAYEATIQNSSFAVKNQPLGSVAGTANHIYHGSRSSRQYQSRWQLLTSYDPALLVPDSAGLYQWGPNATEVLMQNIQQFFLNRNEDQ